MESLPLHPALVHIPLGVALIMPLVAAFLAWRLVKGAPRAVWALVVVLQVVLVAGGFAAMRTGEDDEEKVEEVVGDDLIHEHEEAAELFVWTGVGTLVATVVPLFAPPATALLAVLLSLAVAGLGLRAGHLGGELVYEHGAASAHLPRGKPGVAPAVPGLPQGLDDDDGDTDER